jgi:uncharacterized protein
MPPVEFEYDPLKSAANLWKHGITLGAACGFWGCEIRRYGRASNKPGEKRHAIYCEYEGEIWVAFFTLREGKVRLFSARRASRKERKAHRL